MTIGDRIRTYRHQNQLTQEALANKLGISPQAVSKWEQNITAPDISLLPDLAACFSITTDELLGAGRYTTPSGYENYPARLAAIYEEGGTEEDFDRAIAAYHDLLLHGTPETRDYMMYGYLYNIRARRDMETALTYYKKALKFGKETRDDWWFKTQQQVTLLLCMQGRGAEAIAEKQAWLNQEPGNIQALLSLIWAYYHAGKPNDALPYAKQALEKGPENPYVLYALGEILGGEKGLGRYEEAMEYWDRAFQLNADFADCLFSKAHAYEQHGQYENAIEAHRKIIDWLHNWGADIGVETAFSEEKIQELSDKLK